MLGGVAFMRTRIALSLLFYLAGFPSRTPTDLLVFCIVAALVLISGYKELLTALKAVVEEAHSEKVDSFISRKWRQYCLGGFSREMTTSLAHCLFAMFCVKYGFDALHAGAEQIPPVAHYSAYILYLGGVILVGLTLHRFVDLWLELGRRIREGESKAQKNFTRFSRLFLKPVVACALLLYASDMLKFSAATFAKGGWYITSQASAP
jgi:hypothetical protein